MPGWQRVLARFGILKELAPTGICSLSLGGGEGVLLRFQAKRHGQSQQHIAPSGFVRPRS